MTLHNVGQLQGVSFDSTDGTYTEAHTYDGLARVSQRDISMPGQGTFSCNFGYDAATPRLDTLMTAASLALKAAARDPKAAGAYAMNPYPRAGQATLDALSAGAGPISFKSTGYGLARWAGIKAAQPIMKEQAKQRSSRVAARQTRKHDREDAGVVQRSNGGCLVLAIGIRHESGQ